MFLPLHDRNPIRHVNFPFVTYALIAINVVVFLFQLTQGEYRFNETAYILGVVPIEVRHGDGFPVPWFHEYCTLVTYAFLHANWLHLLSNMLFLWIFGDNIEDALGHVKFLAFYLVCGVLAALAHIAFNFNGAGPLIGASGAVSGVIGAYIVLYPHARVYVLFKLVVPIPLPIPALWMLGAWIAVQIFNLFVAGDSPVAWWAHLGGVVVGALLVIPLRRKSVELFGGR